MAEARGWAASRASLTNARRFALKISSVGAMAIVIAGGVTLALRRWMPRVAGVLFGGR